MAAQNEYVPVYSYESGGLEWDCFDEKCSRFGFDLSKSEDRQNDRQKVLEFVNENRGRVKIVKEDGDYIILELLPTLEAAPTSVVSLITTFATKQEQKELARTSKEIRKGYQEYIVGKKSLSTTVENSDEYYRWLGSHSSLTELTLTTTTDTDVGKMMNSFESLKHLEKLTCSFPKGGARYEILNILSQIHTLESINLTRLNIEAYGILRNILPQLPLLTHLVLKETELTDECLEVFKPGFEALRELRDLEIHRFALSQEGLASLAGILPHFPKLRRLHFPGIAFGDDLMFGEMFSVMATLPDLDDLNVSNNRLSDDEIRILGPLISSSHIKRLNLGGCSLSAEAMEELTNCFTKESQLESLNLQYNNLSEDDNPNLGKILQQTPHLKHLDLAGNEMLSQRGLDQLMVIGQLTELEYLSLKELTLQSEDSVGLNQILSRLPHLRVLMLDGNTLTTSGLVNLVPSLSNLHDLEEFGFDGYGSDAGSVPILTRILAGYPKLKWLRFDDTSETFPICDIRLTNPLLEFLQLDIKKNDRQSIALFESLQGCHHLKELRIFGSQLMIPQIESLSRTLRTLTELKKFTLSNVSLEGFRILAKSFPPSLQSIQTQFGRFGIHALREFAPLFNRMKQLDLNIPVDEESRVLLKPYLGQHERIYGPYHFIYI